ncbi:LysE family translocator [Pelobacter seleniigenes]|uniref:LysE family translocator n=1 Tax=Pelobacter seleniigenes TaxID=407188 RepID=UPI0004A6E23E|nr:LysE family translocator [Pelobacter seleniigenes]
MTLTMLSVFIPTFILVSLTPGMCMTLSLSLGMTIGLRRTFWMMYGELLGVGLVAAAAVVGVAAVTLRYPALFLLFKIAGGTYLGYLGVQLWRSRGALAMRSDMTIGQRNMSAQTLAAQGFVTAVANPKGWAFFIALLPPFIDYSRPLPGQLGILLSIVLAIEFASLIIYAGSGRALHHLLLKKGNLLLLNRIAGSAMIGVGIWLGLA